jgi:hypothetical protein
LIEERDIWADFPETCGRTAGIYTGKDCMAVDAVSAEPLSLAKFPLTGKIQGIFALSGSSLVSFSSVYALISSIPFPAAPKNREFFRPYQGIFRHRTRNSNA